MTSPITFPPRPASWTEMNIGGCLDYDADGPFLWDTIKIVNPKNILEIGFFAGSSSYCWLQLSDAKLTSVDPMVNLYDSAIPHTGRPENVDKLKAAFPDRFTFIQKDSKLVRPDLAGQQFDLMFIDGDHAPIGIRNDFNLALELNIPWVLVDDFVTSVMEVYVNEFKDRFLPPVRVYPRKDQFQGKPIPIVLLRQIDKTISQRYHGT